MNLVVPAVSTCQILVQYAFHICSMPCGDPESYSSTKNMIGFHTCTQNMSVFFARTPSGTCRNYWDTNNLQAAGEIKKLVIISSSTNSLFASLI